MNYNLGDIVTMKKVHPCGSYDFEIIRLGADVKIRCVKCSRVIMIPRVELNKKIKKDKFSAFEYGLYYIKILEESGKKKKRGRISDFMFFTPGR